MNAKTLTLLAIWIVSTFVIAYIAISVSHIFEADSIKSLLTLWGIFVPSVVLLRKIWGKHYDKARAKDA